LSTETFDNIAMANDIKTGTSSDRGRSRRGW